jgi:hypothetical protein
MSAAVTPSRVLQTEAMPDGRASRRIRLGGVTVPSWIDFRSRCGKTCQRPADGAKHHPIRASRGMNHTGVGLEDPARSGVRVPNDRGLGRRLAPAFTSHSPATRSSVHPDPNAFRDIPRLGLREISHTRNPSSTSTAFAGAAERRSAVWEADVEKPLLASDCAPMATYGEHVRHRQSCYAANLFLPRTQSCCLRMRLWFPI